MRRPLNVLLGISGGISAYKAAELVRLLRGRGHTVRCALTRAASSFVTPLTLEVLSGEAVLAEGYLSPSGTGEEQHITAAQWADVLCIAPATAHTLGRLANGLADDFLTTTALACEAPLLLAPAMHSAMWEKPALQRNLDALRADGAHFVGPVTGPLASGEAGIGRMAEPLEIVEAIEAASPPGRLQGYTVLVSAGPTREAVDPVRFVGNRSSGKMGYALAARAAELGARTMLVSGPTALVPPAGTEVTSVTSAAEMKDAVQSVAGDVDLIIMAAAVADFRPRTPASEKIKKRSGTPLLELEATEDILGSLRALAPQAVIVGFAAETADVEIEAAAKLEGKDLDLIVANDVGRDDIGFDSDENEVTLLRRHGEASFFAKQPKVALARKLLDAFAEVLIERREKLTAVSD